MPVFSKTSQDRLSSCHPILRDIFNEVIKNEDCTILVGQRNKQQQNEAFQNGLSKLKYPDSKHNLDPSEAVDAAPWFKNPPHIRWNDMKKFYHFAGYVLGVAAIL